MNTAKMYKIEVDEEVYDFLKRNAEAFVDTTPNSVLRRFLPLESNTQISKNYDADKVFPEFSASVPNALAQILEMIILVKNKGKDRILATHTVADIRGITTQAVIDKYTRQLGRKAYQIDELLMDSNINEFKKLLIERFPLHSKVVESVFSNIEV